MSREAATDVKNLQSVGRLGLDEFERWTLQIIRQFLVAHQNPESQTWHNAFLFAVERWGEPLGLAAAHLASKYVKAVLRFRGNGITFNDPLDVHIRDFATEDEALIMAVLHYMRRDQKSYARDAVAALTQGQMDPDVIRNGLSFAARFSVGTPPRSATSRVPELSVVT